MEQREDLQVTADRFKYELAELLATARAMSSQRDIRKLLGLILEKSREVTGADAGSVYVLEGDGAPAERLLHFMLSQNDSIRIDFQEFTLGVDEKSMVGNAVLNRRPINIPDLGRLDDPSHNPWGFKHNKSFDLKTGYQTRSMLTVPMLSARDEVIGVIQLINRKRRPSCKLLSLEDFRTQVVPFDERCEELALALASQAGVSLENTILYDEIRSLFEGFVDASVTAIESRDPTTSGHSRRVATLTVALAEKVDAIDTGPYRDVHFTPEDLRKIEFAGILHDFGKVGVREKVLVKAKKLYEAELESLRMRFAFIRKSWEAEAAQRKLQLAIENAGRELQVEFAEVDEELRVRLAQLKSDQEFVVRCNEPTVLEEGGFERLVEIARCRYTDTEGVERPLLEPNELAALQVRRGSLTELERVEIESHVIHSFNFLQKIPWGRSMRDIPRIAGAHHEYLNGRGYPRHLPAEQIPIESRMMTISDIFDALTASDRPYKRAVPPDRALRILDEEVKAGKCDGELLRIFVESEVYKRVL